MPTHIFSAQLQLKDAVLETIAEIVVTAPQVTNFSRRLQAGKIEISRPNDGEKDLFLLGMPFQENMNIRQGGRGDTYNGYCWGLTDDKGYLYCDYKPSTITLTVNGSNIRRLVVFGDKRAKQWATEAYRDGNPEDKIYSDDVEWAIQWDKPANTHSVTFTRWNRANYNACITSVKPFGDTISFLGPSTLRYFETLTQITPRPGERYYGVTPNRGQLEVVARGEIKDYIEDGIISDELLGVKILRDNDVIATHNVSDSNYDMHSKILTLDLTDNLSRWGVLKYPGRGLTEETDAFSLLVEVMGGLGYSEADVERMCVKEIAVGTEDEEMMVAEYLKAIRIPYPYLEPATYRATIEKFCVLGQLCCYSDPNGFPVFVSGRPRPTKAERASVKGLPIWGQTSPLRMGIIKKNRVKKVEIEVNEIKEEFGNIGESVYLNYIEIGVPGTQEDKAMPILVYNDASKNNYYDTIIVPLENSISQAFFVTKEIKIPIESKFVKNSDIDKLNLNCEIQFMTPFVNIDTDRREFPTKTYSYTKVTKGTPSEFPSQAVLYDNLRLVDGNLVFDFYAKTYCGSDFDISVINARIQWKGNKRETKDMMKNYS